MDLVIGHIGGRRKNDISGTLFERYVKLISPYSPVKITECANEHSFFFALNKLRTRTLPYLILLDSRGKLLSSEQFAQSLGKLRDDGRQTVVLAVGPADGWSEEARKRADLLLSLGPMTLPHELARVVLSEQVYRAFTILSGHPYHTGH